MAKNSNLAKAKRKKNDEFYTRLSDIENELHHYKHHFKGKVVYCNCDDPSISAFWKFFTMNFQDWGLKKLIATHYEKDEKNFSYKIEMKPGDTWNEEPEKIPLLCNGDFRSAACIELLKEADIVVTNPPFSLFREYVAQLMEYEKKFVIIGSVNAVTYKEFFPLLKNGKVWAGYHFNKTFEFIMPDTYELKGKAYVDEEGKKHGFVPGIAWYTNLDIKKRHEPLDLRGNYYDPEVNLKYDNYDAIEVSKTGNIPCDYDGVMGVPITFLDKYCPEQFEILGLLKSSTDEQAGIPNLRFYNDFKEMRQDMSYTGSGGGKAHGHPVLQGKSKKGNFLYNPVTGEYVHAVYARIVIRKK